MNVEITRRHISLSNQGWSLPLIGVEIAEWGITEVLEIGANALREQLGLLDPRALDLLLVASVVYAVDKSVPRRLMDDRWTREFTVTFPVGDPVVWNAAQEPLTRALDYLTGDVWSISFTSWPDVASLLAGNTQHGSRRTRPTLRRATGSWSASDASVVSLFSGGVDSLAGALDTLADDRDHKLLLIGHGDANAVLGDQRRVYEKLRASTYADRVRHIATRVGIRSSSHALPDAPICEPYGRESTLRSRSLVFLALGLCAARVCGPDIPLVVPENGFIAVNLPLTPARVGSCSTRTTHPYYLHCMRTLAAAVGIANPIRDVYRFQTKGEVLQSCRDADTLCDLVPETVSCAHATRRAHWHRRGARNCGYCVPCMVRRAALHRIGRDDGLAYGIDVGAAELDIERANTAADVRAVLDCVREMRSSSDVAARARLTGPLPSADRAALVAMLVRGVDELRSWVRDRGSPVMHARAGIHDRQ